MFDVVILYVLPHSPLLVDVNETLLDVFGYYIGPLRFSKSSLNEPCFCFVLVLAR